MYNYNVKSLLKVIEEVFTTSLTTDEIKWITEHSDKFSKSGDKAAFYKSFTATPRFVKKRTLDISYEKQIAIEAIRKDFKITNFTSDALARIWFLLNFPTENKDHYLSTIDQLFPSAEMNELVALYSALPLLAFPEEWEFRCTEGIRSNIGSVLESVICNNPYPSEYLDEAAWNQLVLKAFFTEKPVNEIIGLDQRANQKLANTLSDYAHERWAAHRSVNPLLWRLVCPFLNQTLFEDIQKIFQRENEVEKKAAALACSQSNFAPAIELLNTEPDLKLAIEKKELTWQTISDTADAKE